MPKPCLSWAQANGAIPANSIAPSTSALGRRIRAILDRRSRERPAGSLWTAARDRRSASAVATPVAAMKLVAAVQAPPPAPAAPLRSGAPRGSGRARLRPRRRSHRKRRAAEAPDVPGDITINVGPDVEPGRERGARRGAAEIPQIVASRGSPVNPPEDVEDALGEAEDEMREAGRLQPRRDCGGDARRTARRR